jgi:hypothetical protein
VFTICHATSLFFSEADITSWVRDQASRAAASQAIAGIGQTQQGRINLLGIDSR